MINRREIAFVPCALLLLVGFARSTPAQCAEQPTEPQDDGGDHSDAEGNEESDNSEPPETRVVDIAEEDEVVVTATRRNSPLKDVPAMVTVVGHDELEHAPHETLDEHLQRIPSVSHSREHHAECGPGRDITLRGIHDQKRTLVLLDGIPVNDAITGAVNWSMIPPDAVERVEVVRGPMSALYGSGAMGGVINIITRTPRRPNETSFGGSYGSLDSAAASLRQGGMFDNVGYLAAGRIYRTDGYVQAAEDQDYHTPNARTDLSLLGKFLVFPDERSLLTFRISYVNEDYSRGIRTDDQNNSVAALSLTYGRVTRQDINLTGSLYGRYMTREVDLGAPPVYLDHDHTEFDDVKEVGQLFQVDFPVAGFNTVSVGIDSSYATMDRRNEYDLVERVSSAEGNQLSVSLFAQDELTIGKPRTRLIVTPGVRVDYSRAGDGASVDTNPAPNPAVDETYPDRAWVAVNPKVSAVFRHADSTSIRASVGRSFASPTLFELYTVFTRGPMLLYGNPELDPESAWSVDVGVDQWFHDNFLGRLSGYYTRGEEFIGTRMVDGNPLQLQMDNITAVQILGGDVELQLDLASMWSFYGGYTINQSTVLEDDSDATIEGNQLPFEPLHRARLGVVFHYQEWVHVDLSARYSGASFTDIENTEETMLDHHLSLDLAVSGALFGLVRWKFAFRNLLNHEYDIYSVPTQTSVAPGFLFDGHLALTF